MIPHHKPLHRMYGSVLTPLLVCIWFSVLFAGGPPSYYYPDPSISTNGIVRVVFFHEGTLYVGGSFTKAYDADGAHSRTDLAAWDMVTGRVTGFVAKTDRGTVRAVAAGSGKLYVGGTFTSINKVDRARVAALDPVTGEVIADFRTDTSTVVGEIWALAVSGGKLFVGGEFSSIDGYIRSGIAAMDCHTGMVDARFDPAPGDWFEDSGKTSPGVYTLEVCSHDSGLILAGGGFQTICGDDSSPFLVALRHDGSRGAGFDVPAPAPVHALDAHGNFLGVAAGGFSNRVVAYSVDSGGFERVWKSDRVQGDVQAITYAEQGYVFCGFHGGFYDSSDEYHMASIDANTGDFIEPYPAMNSYFGIWALDFADSILAAGGEFTKMNGVTQKYLSVFRKLPFRADSCVPPRAPVLGRPDNGWDELPADLLLEWKHGARTVSYDLQLVADGPDSIDTIIGGLTGDSFLCVNLATATFHRWRMRSVGECATVGAWSEEQWFITAPGKNDVPIIATPVNGAVNQPLASGLCWHPVKKARSYSLQLVEFSNRSSMIIDAGEIGDTGFCFSGLINDAVYYWRVRAETPGGPSEWMDAAFRTVVAAPRPPFGALPADNAVRVACQPELRWQNIESTVSYRVQVAADAGFTSLIFDTAGLVDTAVVVSPLVDDTRYFWRIDAVNPGGDAWSPVMQFSTIYPSPCAPLPVAPETGTVAASGMAHLVWNRSSPHVSIYRVEIARDSAMLDPVVDTLVADTEYVKLGLEDGTAFWWRVSAYNESGWGAASAKRRIATSPSGGPRPAFKLRGLALSGPRPFVAYDIALECNVRMELFDLKGQSVWIGNRSNVTPGSYRDAVPASQFTPGRYFLAFKAGKYEKKMAATLVR